MIPLQTKLLHMLDRPIVYGVTDRLIKQVTPIRSYAIDSLITRKLIECRANQFPILLPRCHKESTP